MYKEITQCRICGNRDLVSVLHLGNFSLTGIFPREKGKPITRGPIELVRCRNDEALKNCGLLQLRQSYNPAELYGDNYGYRSGLNRSMIVHLQAQVKRLLNIVPLEKGDFIIDIGSNDGTLLSFYNRKDLTLVGIDPTGAKFQKYYPDHIQLISDFFSARLVREHFGGRKAKVITSFAMFYDLESPLDFMREIYEVLDQDGVWIFEQSYMPTMLARTLYDTICHEHLEYYGLTQIKWMTDQMGFKIVDAGFNDTNGGSFCVTVAKKDNSKFSENTQLIQGILMEERSRGLMTPKPYEEFKEKVMRHRQELRACFSRLKERSQTIFGYGASTKGNVILQFCQLTAQDIPCIAEVNDDKLGCFTPGTEIPIISEEEGRRRQPDYFLVLPWHFKKTIIEREQEYLNRGGHLLMPLPGIEIISCQGSKL